MEDDIRELPKGLTKTSTFVRNASSKFRQEVRKLASFKSEQLSEKIGRFDRTKPSAADALKGLQFVSNTDAAGWADVEKRFYKNATTDGLLPRAKFGVCMGMSEKESDEFDGKLYDVLARRKNITTDSINKTQLKEFWEQLVADQSFDSRLQTFFDMADKDGDGRLTKEEVNEIIKLSASSNSLSQIRNQADEYATMIMEACDPQKLGYIMIWNLEWLLLHASTDQSEKGVEGQTLSRMLSQKLEAKVDPNPIVKWYKYLLHNWQRIWLVLLWIAIMAGLFAWKYVQYKEKAAYKVMGHCVCFAKGAAETLKLNMAIILLPVCRNTITWLRNKTRIGAAVALDDNLNFHKMIAVAIALGVAIHGLAHLTCDFPRLLNASKEEYEPMKYYFGDQPTSYEWFIKGVEGVTGIIMVVLMAIAFSLATPWFRRGKGFNAFWYSHHLFVIVYSLLIVHGIKLYITKSWYNKTTWMYLAVPITLYAGERLLRSFRSRIKAVQILEVAVYHDNLLALHMSKPQRYKYKSGQYMFVNCDAVSRFEWHPFSISSAPGDDYLSVHIRAIGDWTKEIKEVFKAVCTPNEQGILRADNLQGENNANLPRVLIDGPYGASLQDYKKYEVVLLVCLGIGVTPMISILKDIMNNVKAREEEEKSLENGDGSRAPKSSPGSGIEEIFNTRRAYFYWVTRQDTFVWFNDKLNEIAEMDHTGIIEMHNHCSSVYKDGDAHSALITTLQFLHQAKKGDDILSGTRVKSHFGRPDWQNVYKSIAYNNPEAKSVGVFTCGATPKLTKELNRQALDISHKTSIKFDFHKENF